MTLKHCKICNQMTNHKKGKCQKCCNICGGVAFPKNLLGIVFCCPACGGTGLRGGK